MSIAMVYFGNILIITLIFMSDEDGVIENVLINLATFVMFNLSTYKVFFLNLLSTISTLIRLTINNYSKLDIGSATYLVLNYAILMVGIFIISTFVGFKLEKNRRNEYKLLRSIEI